MTLDLDLDLDLDLGPGSGPDWSSRPPPRILYLRYTGFKGLILTSRALRLPGPRIGYARLLVPRYMSNQSQGMDYISVIDLGHKAKQPLM